MSASAPAPDAVSENGMSRSEVDRLIERKLGEEFGIVPMHRIAGKETLLPPGTIMATARSEAPDGYLLCDGSAVARSAFAELFSAIGTTYGAGDGSTTFNLPDLRGRVPVGVDGAAGRLAANDALGGSAGAETHALTAGELASHSHGPGTLTCSIPYADVTNTTTTGAGTRVTQIGGGGSTSPPVAITGATAPAGSGSAHNNMPPYAVVNWMVKT